MATEAEPYKATPLWDGAITVSIPSSFDSISTMVNAPDNQELLTDPDHSTSLIVELLEQVSAIGTTALKEHIADVSPNVDDIKYIVEPTAFESNIPGFAALVRQPPGGGRGEHTGDTAVAYGLIRYDAGETDVLVSVCVRIDGPWDGKVDSIIERGTSIRDTFLKTFEVKDPGLFGA